jgi:hypothetical protein
LHLRVHIPLYRPQAVFVTTVTAMTNMCIMRIVGVVVSVIRTVQLNLTNV